MPVFCEKRQLVVPGDLLAEGDYEGGENTYQEGEKVYATRVGLADYEGRRLHVVALNAFYIPSVGDLVIGKVVEVGFTGWNLDIRAPYVATLRASDTLSRSFRPQRDDLPSIFDVGDLILCKVTAYDRTRDPLVSIREPGLGKITRGQIAEVTPTKIPRVIGREGSMVNILKGETGCRIVVGQNGRILVSGRNPEDERLAIRAIRKIEQEAHTRGLTDRVTEMLRREKGGVVESAQEDA